MHLSRVLPHSAARGLALIPRLPAGSYRGQRSLAAADAPAFDVEVTSVDPVADPQTRLASLYAPIPPQANIASGETLRGVVTVGRRAGVLAIPYAALLDDGGEAYVFTVEEGVAKRRTVTTGAEDNGLIEIRSGLEPGSKVVVSGGTALEDGIRVRVAE